MGELRGIVRRYYAYKVTNAYGFYLPVSILYLTEVKGFGMEVIGLTGAAFLFAEVAAEIPTGYVGDRLGRRASLAAGNALSAVALGLWAVADSPLAYVALNAVWAVGWAFRSGTGKAWLYEILDAHGEADEFARVSGRANTALMLASAATAVAGGALVTVDWSLPFLANALLSALGIPILLTLPTVESERAARDDAGVEDETFTVGDALAALRLQVRRPEIRWFVAFAALLYALFELSRTFEQPAMAAAGVSAPALGVLYAGFKLVSAGAAASAGWVEDRLGVRGAFALLVPLLGATYATIAFAPVLVVPVVFLTRGVRSLFRPLRNQYLNDRVENVGRATVLSGATMVLSLVAGATKVVGGYAAAALGPIRFLAAAGVASAAAAGLVWVAVSPVRPRKGPESAGGDSDPEASVATD
ncbi:MFS transporter (plasmid) [Halorussus limi]|uniref:MFS transporter n=1 Tax=Halorussus limi TaxID=2938695 RepID=A0A8U0I0N1_9EURY|nr:MFS transporter [Halorussus limi]UPV76466.1 MFS transporter [Halorussus limi]